MIYDRRGRVSIFFIEVETAYHFIRRGKTVIRCVGEDQLAILIRVHKESIRGNPRPNLTLRFFIAKKFKEGQGRKCIRGA